jgi:hypothetical protein
MAMKNCSTLLIWLALTSAFGQDREAFRLVGPPSGQELTEISVRGMALAEYDAAAWHGTDAVRALKPPPGAFQLYIARKKEKGWVVAFGRWDGAKSRFLIVYEALQNGSSTEYTAVKHEPPLEDRDVYLRAAKAFELAKAEFLGDAKPQRPYNLAILPTVSGDWYVYAVPAQTDLAVLPYGGDIRYTVTRDGTRVVDRRQMHKTVIEEQTGRPYLGFHTHVLSNVPEDSDVFYALTRNATQGEWIATPKYIYQISPYGSLSFLGKTEDTIKQLQEGKFDAFLGNAKSPMLSTLQRLQTTSPPDPLEAVALFAGARCQGNSVWLKFSVTIRNTSDTKIILYKDVLQTAQARFAAAEADIFANRYEKLVFTALEPADLSYESAFLVLDAGRSFSQEREYPILGLDLKGKSVVQFLFIPWPLGQEKQQDAMRARWAQTGLLYTEGIFAPPVQFWVEPNLLETCKAK